MTPIKHFVLVYDVERAALDASFDFGSDADAALDKYAELEAKSRIDVRRLEIVLVGSDSLDTVHKTHSHYFGAQALEEIVSS